MKYLKISLVLFAFVFFNMACNEAAKTNNGNTANVNNPTNANAVVNSNTQPTATLDQMTVAKNIYMDKCVKCHKEDGTGGKVEIDGKTIKAANFTGEHMKKDKDEELIEQIKEGGDGMPAYKDKLTDQQIKDLVKFIRTEFQPK